MAPQECKGRGAHRHAVQELVRAALRFVRIPKNKSQPLSDRLYGALLHFLPFDFRSEFGSDMEEVFREQRRHEHSPLAVFKMWWATIRDLAAMAPREHLSVLAQDTRYALRMMGSSPGYTLASVLILALGIGANSAIFSVVNSILLRPLPYTQDRQLVVLHQQRPKAGVNNLLFSAPEIQDYRQGNNTLSGLVEYHTMLFTLFSRDGAQRVRTGVVSAGFFGFLGVKPLFGRAFGPNDEKPGASPVLLLSYEFWKQRQNGNPSIVGQTFEMNDRVHTVIGVLPPIPQYPDENDVYMTTVACPFRSSAKNVAGRKWRLMSVFGRLKTGVTLDQCRSNLAAVARKIEHEHPETYPPSLGYAITSAMLRDDLTRNVRSMLLLLFGTAVFVLIIACANVANLTLARAARRERELIIRSALGAGSGRLLRQLVTESFILAMLAAGVGLLLASGSLSLLTRFARDLTPRAREISLDGRALAFTVLCASLSAIIFGSAAALHARHDLQGRVLETVRRSRVRNGLIAAQVAFSYVLLVGAALMVRSFIQLNRVDPGFAPQQLFAAAIDLNWSKYKEPEQFRAVSKLLLEKVESLPGILSAAVSSSYPLDPDTMFKGGWTEHFRIYGRGLPAAEPPPASAIRIATPGYFRTLGIPLIQGRALLDSDGPDAPPVIVINNTLARHYWPDGNAIGKKISVEAEKWWTIVGVVGDVKEFGLGRETPNQIYGALDQFPTVGSVLVRTVGELEDVDDELRQAIREVDPQIAITLLKPLEQVRADSVSSPRAIAKLFVLFAVLALVIAATGLGSMLAVAVRQRTREIGIRMALGATPANIVRSFVRQGVLLVVLGLGFGFLGALLLTGLLKPVLFGVAPTDPLTFVCVSALLLGAALIACSIPALRAARIDPQLALRFE